MPTRAVIPYRAGELEAREQEHVWTARLGNREARASYLDLALAELLGDAPEAHRAATRLMLELVEVVEEQKPVYPPNSRRPARGRYATRRQGFWAKPLALGLRVLAFAIVASTAFMLTSWFTTLR